jgi:hypothetical protein
MASMIASFFSRAKSSEELFRRLEIGAAEGFDAHINQHNVIYISFNEIPQTCTSYREYIDRIQRRLRNDLRREFPNVEVREDEAVWDILGEIYELENEPRFIFVLDEWDYIFHRNFVSDRDKEGFIDFLSNLLKGKDYVELAYMTGILPIAKSVLRTELRNLPMRHTEVV